MFSMDGLLWIVVWVFLVVCMLVLFAIHTVKQERSINEELFEFRIKNLLFKKIKKDLEEKGIEVGDEDILLEVDKQTEEKIAIAKRMKKEFFKGR